LFVACRDHNGGPPTSDPTLGVCWDADRINIWRVGITPREEFLSTKPGRALVEEARGFHARLERPGAALRAAFPLAGGREASAR
jgi:hypothetical protein